VSPALFFISTPRRNKPDPDDRPVRRYKSTFRLAQAELVELAAGMPGRRPRHSAGDSRRPLFGLALDVAFWISLVAVAVAALTIVVNAWGRYHGPLLVAPALALLFVMNIFPLMWSFGLSFFDYKANRIKPLSFIGFDNYARVLNDVDVWSRLQTTALVVVLTVSLPDVHRLPAGAAIRTRISRPAHPADAGADADDAEFRRRRRLLPLLLRSDLRLAEPGLKAVTGESLTLLATPAGAMAGIVFADFLDVVAVRHAAGTGRAGQRAALPLRGGRGRPRLVVAQVPHHHLPLYRGLLMLALLFRTIEASSCSTWSTSSPRADPDLDGDDRRLCLPGRLPVFPHQPVTALAYILLFIVIVLTNLYLYLVRQRSREA